MFFIMPYTKIAKGFASLNKMAVDKKFLYLASLRERSGSVVECLTRDRRAAGSSLTGVTALCP